MARHTTPDAAFPWRWPVVIAIATGFVAFVGTSLAQELSDAEFFGRAPELERRLESPVTLAWQGIPLRQAAERLASTQKLAIWVDRRVDPGQPLDLDLSDVPLRTVCDRIASETRLAWVAYGNVVCFGPADETAELRTLRALARQRLAALPPGVRQAWLRPQPLTIRRLAEPRSVVEKLADSLDVRVKNLDAIPHDVWPARELPAMAPADQLTLLLAGFDLAWRLDSQGTQLEIVPVARPVVARRTIPGGTARRAEAQQLAAEDKQVKVERQGNGLTLVARVEQHEQLIDKPAPPRVGRNKPAPKPGAQVYSLTIREQPLEGLLRQLTTKLGLTLEITPEVGSETRAARVSFAVSEVPVEELFAAIAKAAGVAIDIADGKVRVAPAE